MSGENDTVGTRTHLGHVRLARYESDSRPGTFYWVSANPDRTTISCQCRGWIHNKHCRHTADVQTRLTQVGGLTAALRFLNRGIDVELQAPRTGTSLAAGRRRARQVLENDAIAQEASRVCEQYFGGASRPSSGHLELRAAIEAAIRKFAGKATAPAPVQTIQTAAAMTGKPDWLGGGRAIRLRE